MCNVSERGSSPPRLQLTVSNWNHEKQNCRLGGGATELDLKIEENYKPSNSTSKNRRRQGNKTCPQTARKERSPADTLILVRKNHLRHLTSRTKRQQHGIFLATKLWPFVTAAAIENKYTLLINNHSLSLLCWFLIFSVCQMRIFGPQISLTQMGFLLVFIQT